MSGLVQPGISSAVSGVPRTKARAVLDNVDWAAIVCFGLASIGSVASDGFAAIGWFFAALSAFSAWGQARDRRAWRALCRRQHAHIMERAERDRNAINWSDFVRTVEENLPQKQRAAAVYAMELAISPALTRAFGDAIADTSGRPAEPREGQ